MSLKLRCSHAMSYDAGAFSVDALSGLLDEQPGGQVDVLLSELFVDDGSQLFPLLRHGV